MDPDASLDEPFEAPSAEELLGYLLDDVVSDQHDANRRLALRAAHIVEAIDLAVRHPYVYTTVDDARLAPRLAERAVVFDLSLRLQLAEPAVRDLARIARDAGRRLPQLWRRALEGYVAPDLVDRALVAAYRLAATDGATKDEKDAAAAAIREIDSATEAWAVTCTPAGFRRRLARLIDRLDRVRAEVRHARAMRDRKVVVEFVDDGMAWISALVPSVEALGIKRRLTSTAKHLAKHPDETRTRDQLRADLFSAWLRGVGTATAVKTKVFVTIPATLLAGNGRVPVEPAPGAPVPVEPATLVGHGPIDPLTAKQLFLDATSFRRVITDPVSGVIVDMDRRTYRPTRAQRDWLALHHGTCSRDGCTRLALDADIDHEMPWAQGGRTDLRLLRPLCPPDHRHRHLTRFRYRSRSDGTVEVTTPTGFVTSEPPPF